MGYNIGPPRTRIFNKKLIKSNKTQKSIPLVMDPRQELGENINYVRQIEIQLVWIYDQDGS